MRACSWHHKEDGGIVDQAYDAAKLAGGQIHWILDVVFAVEVGDDGSQPSSVSRSAYATPIP